MNATAPFNLGDLFRADFRTSQFSDATNTMLQKSLCFDYRYQPARIAIGLSLSLSSPPPAPADILGKPIRGETLFGQEESDMALWVALICTQADVGAPTRKQFFELVAAHWSRGIQLMSKKFEEFDGSPQNFLMTM